MTATMEMKEINVNELVQVTGGEEGLGFDKIIELGSWFYKALISSNLPETFEEFYQNYLDHHVAVDAAIMSELFLSGCLTGTGAIQAELYRRANKKVFYKKVYDTFK